MGEKTVTAATFFTDNKKGTDNTGLVIIIKIINLEGDTPFSIDMLGEVGYSWVKLHKFWDQEGTSAG